MMTLLYLFISEYGVSPKHILKDVWVFRYSPTLIEDRLKQAFDAGVEIIKPWVVRCTKDVFLKYDIFHSLFIYILI